MTRTGRVNGAVGLAVVLVVLELGAPVLFTPLVAVALPMGALINVRAWWRLRSKHQAYPALAALRERYLAARILAIAAVSLAVLGAFVGARILHLLEPIPPQVFLLLLAYPCLLMSGPAIEWLATYGVSDPKAGQ